MMRVRRYCGDGRDGGETGGNKMMLIRNDGDCGDCDDCCYDTSQDHCGDNHHQ